MLSAEEIKAQTLAAFAGHDAIPGLHWAQVKLQESVVWSSTVH